MILWELFRKPSQNTSAYRYARGRGRAPRRTANLKALHIRIAPGNKPSGTYEWAKPWFGFAELRVDRLTRQPGTPIKQPVARDMWSPREVEPEEADLAPTTFNERLCAGLPPWGCVVEGAAWGWLRPSRLRVCDIIPEAGPRLRRGWKIVIMGGPSINGSSIYVITLGWEFFQSLWESQGI